MVYSDSPLAHWCIPKRYPVKTDAIRHWQKKWLNISLLAWERETEQLMSNLQKKVGNSNLGNNWNLENVVEKRHEISLWGLHHAPSPVHFTNSNLVFKQHPETQLLKQWQMLANINTLPGSRCKQLGSSWKEPLPAGRALPPPLDAILFPVLKILLFLPCLSPLSAANKGKIGSLYKTWQTRDRRSETPIPSGPGLTRTITWVSDQSPNL